MQDRKKQRIDIFNNNESSQGFEYRNNFNKFRNHNQKYNLKHKNMKKEYFKVILDMSKRSAYEYRKDSEIPTRIEYGRRFDSKFEENIIESNFSNVKMHDLLYLIKRDANMEDIIKQMKANY